jgi:hypothetical protein
MSDLQEWKQHPVTVRVLKALEDTHIACKDETPYLCIDSVEETALRNCHAKGFLEGLKSLHDVIDMLQDAERGEQKKGAAR